jgi:hypothetical protein
MRVRRAVLLLVAAALGGPAVATGARDEPLPFAVGEELAYQVRASGVRGHGTMTVEGPVDVRGTETYHLRFLVKAGLGPFKGTDRTESWLDPERMAALRFRSAERHIFARRDERVELYPRARRWETADGQSGESPTDAPLDELSFIYFVRSLPLTDDTSYTFNRYFDAERNPTVVRVLARDTLTTRAGSFRIVLVEMRVRDPRHYAGEGTLRFALSDDTCRLPVRIESAMPNVGRVVFTLDAYRHPSGPCAAGPS